MTHDAETPVDLIERRDPDLRGDEVAVALQFLDYHRDTLRRKCAGLSEEQLKRRAVSPSALSLLGLVRHLTEVERSWCAVHLGGGSTPPIYVSDAAPDGDFDDLESASVASVWATYDATVAESRRIVAGFADGAELTRGRQREPRNLRWILAHLFEEYARHNGHADLLREVIDGVTGE